MEHLTTRNEWHAAPPLKRLIPDELPWGRLWLHHTAGNVGGAAVMRQVQRQHQSTAVPGGPWRDIAYNVGVGNDGTYEGIGIGIRHLNEDHGRSGTIVLLGNYHDNPVPAAMMERVAQLVAHGVLSGWWSCLLTGGHRDLERTACPGNFAYAAIPLINTRARAILDAVLTPSPQPPDDEDEDMKRWIVRAPDGSVWLFDGATKRPANNAVYRNKLRYHGAITPSMNVSVDDWFQWDQVSIDSIPDAE